MVFLVQAVSNDEGVNLIRMEKMKKIVLFCIPLFILSACYESYVKDYEFSAVYVANQYDLRSFVVGESMQFDFGVVLGGVMNNTEDRAVRFELDDELVTGDLSAFGADSPFTALDGMLDAAPLGTLSQKYVTDAVSAAGLTALTPLPASLFSLSDNGRMTVKKGEHTATVTLKTDPTAFLADEHVGVQPYYAVAYRILSADADTVLLSKSFSVIALRCENTFFGWWYHGGKSRTTAADGTTTEAVYPTRIPGDTNTSEVYEMVSVSPYAVKTNFFHNQKDASMQISMEGDAVVVSAPDGSITDMGSGWNKAKLLQDRKIFLNYSYTAANGSVTVVTDTLSFRNRIRDGVNEWQDENPAHYN